MTFDPEHTGCQATIGRLSAQLARETAANRFLSRMVAVQHDWIEQLEHEQAIDAGRLLPDEVEQYLADQEGGA